MDNLFSHIIYFYSLQFSLSYFYLKSVKNILEFFRFQIDILLLTYKITPHTYKMAAYKISN